MTRRQVAIAFVLGAVAVAVTIALAVPMTRAPAFHRYADQRSWLGIPHAGDVVSNAGFLIVAIWSVLRAQTSYARLACLGVAAIALGSGAYHVAPSDTTLAFDWAPIAITLMIVTAAVIDDRIGERAGRFALVVGPLLAVASVVLWLATGGTGGGTVTPYGAVQALGITLPPLIALVAPGEIPRRPLLLAVLCFAIARLCAANDQQLLAAIGIGGHSLKHVAAAIAAGFALSALTSRPAT
ncbi:MAG TPA: hypothetical protein VIV40_37065 [Kofleriaceae bacterium]